ncbi:hypothetical protein M569_09246, partial [Genlisea aurea]
SAVRRRHHRRRLLKYSPNRNPETSPLIRSTPPITILKLSDNGLQITLSSPSNSLEKVESKLNQIIECGREAFFDLRTLVTFDEDYGRVSISCRRSTVEFFIGLFISGFLVVLIIRNVFKLRKNGRQALVYRRDRSLGGREVLVGTGHSNWSSKLTSNPLDSVSISDYHQKKRGIIQGMSRKEKLPQWWPQFHDSSGEAPNTEGYQRIANQLVQGIVDRRVSGEDISMDDIVQLRYLCKAHRVNVSISTANTRDSLYRVSVNFTLNYCEGTLKEFASIQIGDEGAREFVAGLADNIGINAIQASRMVSGAVAARTHSKILQAWALEVQNKHSEALEELSKVCTIHRVFPPERNSAEMEMVFRGLAKSLTPEQREHILDLFISLGAEDTSESLAEALGLVFL